MLQKFFIVAFLFLASPVFAQESILIQAPGASPMDFAEAAKGKTSITWMNLQIQRIKSNPRQEEKVLALAEVVDRDFNTIEMAVDSLRSEGPLTETSLQFLHDLSEKIQARNPAGTHLQFFKDLSCKTMLIQEVSSSVCATIRVDMQTIRRQWPLTAVVMIESREISIEDASPEIYSHGAYHWTLLSNAQKPLNFYGTYEQLLQQRFVAENLVDGTCQGFSSNIDDFELSSRAMVFFGKNCQKALNQPKESPSKFMAWLDNNKAWIYPVGAVLLGGAALAISDKTLVIDRP